MHTSESETKAASDSFAVGRGDNDSDDEEFQYPADNANESHVNDTHESDEEFSYPVEEPEVPASGTVPPEEIRHSESAEPAFIPLTPEEVEAPTPSQPVTQVSPAQLEALYAAGLDGNLTILKELVNGATSSGDLEPFTFVNSASPRTGLTVVHAAASRGRLDALKWRKSFFVNLQLCLTPLLF